MDEPSHHRRAGTEPLDDLSPLPHEGSRVGFEHLGWTPGWRDHLQGALAGTTPARAAAIAAAVLVVGAVVAVVALRGPGPAPPELTLPLAGGPGDPAATSTTTTTTEPPAPAEVVVHAAGAVAAPGLYRLPAGSRVADALAAAGGPTAEADLDRVNLAAPVVDGERVFVPRPGEDPPAVTGGGRPVAAAAPTAEPVAPIDLNTATLEDLDTLPGVGPATATAILAERDRRGGFTSVEELLDVRGIGEARLAALRDHVRV